MLPAPLRGSPPNYPPSNIEGKEGHERRERETKERQREGEHGERGNMWRCHKK